MTKITDGRNKSSNQKQDCSHIQANESERVETNRTPPIRIWNKLMPTADRQLKPVQGAWVIILMPAMNRQGWRTIRGGNTQTKRSQNRNKMPSPSNQKPLKKPQSLSVKR